MGNMHVREWCAGPPNPVSYITGICGIRPGFSLGLVPGVTWE